MFSKFFFPDDNIQEVYYSYIFSRWLGNVRDEIGAIVDELVINTKKLIRATSKEIDKWKR